MAVLLIAEHDNKSLKDSTHKALTAAAQMGGDVHVLVAGNNAGAAAAQAAKLTGVKKVLHAESPSFERPLAEPMAAMIVSLAGSYDHLVAAATTNGKNYMPRVAALLDVMQISDISEVKSADTFVRLIYAGNAVQTVQSTDAKKVITVRTASFAATGETGSAAIEKTNAAADPGLSTYQSENLTKSDRPELTSAKVIGACEGGATVVAAGFAGVAGFTEAGSERGSSRAATGSASCACTSASVTGFLLSAALCRSLRKASTSEAGPAAGTRS